MTLQEQKFNIWQKKQSSTNKKKYAKRQIALNDYNVFFSYFLKTENTIWQSPISK